MVDVKPSNPTCLVVRVVIGCGLLAALGAACEPDAPAPQATRSSGAEAPRVAKPLAATRQVPQKGHEPDRRVHMQATFWLAIVARDALIDGDLEATRSVARELAEHDYGDAFPASWQRWIAEMQKQARALASAADDAAAGQAVGALAVACGDCHRDQKGGFRLEDAESMPRQGSPETIDARMHRHAVGVEQMWFGLIAPDDGVWRAGTLTLTRAPMDPPIDGIERVDERLQGELERLRDLAKQAQSAPTTAERARIYGEAITTCAHCHHSASYFDP